MYVTLKTQLILFNFHKNWLSFFPFFHYSSILAQLNLGKDNDLALTAQFWSKQCQTQPKIEINDFIIKTPIGPTCYDESTVIIPTKNPQISPIEDPATNGQIIEKKAHR